jgi:hypothetical protein
MLISMRMRATFEQPRSSAARVKARSFDASSIVPGAARSSL